MNILLLNWKDIDNPHVGGAEVIVYELAKRLVKFGHKVTWFCQTFSKAEPETVKDGIHIVRMGNLVSMYIYAPLYYWSLDIKPDLVLDMSNTIFWQTPLWARKSKKIAYLNQLAREVFDYEYPPIISNLGKIIERIQYIFYLNSKFICYANTTKNDIISMGVNPSNIQVFPLGLDHSRYRAGKKSVDPLFICVNRLVRMKRTDLVIRAMKTVHQKHPKAKLEIVGTGYHRTELEDIRNSLGLQGVVHFADENTWYFSKNKKDVKLKLMQRAWALVFPSVKEGWGMTVTECAACGTPALVSNVTGLRDSVVNGKTGLILSQNPSPEEIAGAMIKVIEDGRLRKEISFNCIKWSNEFNWNKSYQAFIKIIESMS